MLKQGNEGGEARALAPNVWRVCGSGGIAVKDQPGMARSVHQGNYRMTGEVKGLVGVEEKGRIVELIMLIKGLDVEYARYVLKREHARQPWLCLPDAIRKAMKP